MTVLGFWVTYGKAVSGVKASLRGRVLSKIERTDSRIGEVRLGPLWHHVQQQFGALISGLRRRNRPRSPDQRPLRSGWQPSKTSDRNLLQQALARCWRGLWAVAGFSMIINVLMLTTALYMLQVYDRVLTSQSTQTLLYLSLIAVGALVLLGVFELLRSRVLVRVGGWIDRVLSPAVFQRGIDSSLVGSSYCTEALRDVGLLRSFFGGGGIMALFDAPWVPVYILVIWLLHPLLGTFAIAGAMLLFGLALANHLLTHRQLAQANAVAAKGMRGAEAAFRNAEVIDGMAMGTTLARRWDARNAETLALQVSASDHAGTLSAMSKSFRLMLQVGILAVGAWLVLKTELTPGGMIAASIILGRALAPVELAIGAWRQMLGAREAWSRLSALFAMAPLHPDAMPLPRPKGHLTVENVSWSPPRVRLPVIKGVSLNVEPGEVLALIGPSAAGKSTLARLMVGIGQPQIGRVRLDGADVFSLSRATFGDYVGYLPQDVALFPGTIRENIARMDDGEPEKVVAAAQMAGVHDMVLRLPNGYETDIGEQGALLSGGQRQRIGLARALYGRPALLVLDEPNANLDAAGEEALTGAVLAAKSEGTTIVLVAHRPVMMTHVDKIAVLNGGQIQMHGPRDDVLAEMRPRAVPRLEDVLGQPRPREVPRTGQPPVRVVSR